MKHQEELTAKEILIMLSWWAEAVITMGLQMLCSSRCRSGKSLGNLKLVREDDESADCLLLNVRSCP